MYVPANTIRTHTHSHPATAMERGDRERKSCMLRENSKISKNVPTTITIRNEFKQSYFKCSFAVLVFSRSCVCAKCEIVCMAYALNNFTQLLRDQHQNYDKKTETTAASEATPLHIWKMEEKLNQRKRKGDDEKQNKARRTRENFN